MKKLLVLIGVGLCLCGSVMAEGTPEQVQKHPEVLKAYLGEEEDIDHVA